MSKSNSQTTFAWRSLYFTLFTISFLAMLAATASAQLSTASINGAVRDPSGAVVPNATVVLRSVDTSVDRTSTSNGSGEYAFLNITPGSYTLEASAPGFGLKRVAAFILTVGQTATFDFALALGTESQVVTVEAAGAQLDLTSANLGTVISTKQTNELPLNGRNFTQLLALTPGVAPIMTGQSNGMSSNGGFAAPVAIGSAYSFPAINGQTNRSNFFLMDGLNDYGTLESTYAVPPIIDAIQEFKVVSHTDNAEFGSVLGGVVNVTTKTGTNTLHASAWEYLRNNVFDGRAYFLPTTQAKPPYHQNQFGASVGGPVVIPKLYDGRSKTFFFGAYQGFRYSQPQDNNLLVPTAAQLAGDESGSAPIYNPFTTRPDPNKPGSYIRDPFPGNQIPQGLIDQRMVQYAKFVFPAAGTYIPSSNSNAVDTTPLIQNQNEFNVRGDQNFGAKNSAWFRYSFINSRVTTSGGLPGLPSATQINAREFGGSFVHIFSPSLILQAQFARVTVLDDGTTRFAKSTSDIYSAVGFADSFANGFAGANGSFLIPSPGISGYANGGESIDDTPKATDSNEYAANVTKIIGSHELKFGGSWTSNLFASPLSQISLGFAAQGTANPQAATGVVTGDPLSSFLLNVPDSGNRRNVDERTRPGGLMSYFFQDTWKATPRLTVNAGLRYDYTFIPAYGTNATIGKQGGIETGDYDFSNGTYVLQKVPPTCSERGFAPCIPGDGTLPAHVVVDPRGKIAHNVGTNFGPRFGFAFKLNDKTVVHAGFGIVFDNWAAVSQTSQNIEGSWPDIGQQIQNNLNYPSTTTAIPNVQAQNPFSASGAGSFPAATPFNQVQWFYDPHIKNPYSEQWNFGVQRQLNNSTAFTVDYVGSATHRANIGGYYNTALTPGPGDPQSRSLYTYAAPTFYDRSAGFADYNALQFQLDKRYANGLSYQVAYTWSRAMNEDDGWFGVEGGVVPDPYNPGANRSPAGYDLPHVLSGNALWEIPVGKGMKYSTGNGFLDYVLGNWQINNIVTWRSGQAYTPIYSSDQANTGNVGWAGYEHADLVGNPTQSKRSAAEWFNTGAFQVPALYSFGTAGRDSLRSQAYTDVDSSVIRQFPFWHEKRFEFRAEAFNVLNHPVFGQPGNDLNTPSSFGRVTTTASTQRELQMSLKFVY